MLTSDGDWGVVDAEDVELEAADGVPESRIDAALDGLHLERTRMRLSFRRHLPSRLLDLKITLAIGAGFALAYITAAHDIAFGQGNRGKQRTVFE